MNYALGCAFTLDEVFENFQYKKLKITCKQCKEAIGDNHRQILVKRVFRAAFKLVIDDVIERNVTFWLPLTSTVKCNIRMNRITNERFQKLRQKGKWEDIDIVASNFTGYEIGFFMLGSRTPRVKTIYTDNPTKALINKYTNQGKQYGDGKIDTKSSDYFPCIQKLFPLVPLQDLKQIVNFGWRSLYLHNSYGGDVLIKNKSMWCYIGNLKTNSIEHFTYYIDKLIKRIRILHHRRKIPWKGYYYFALTDKQYEDYIKQKNLSKEKILFKDIMLYEILDECSLRNTNNKYIFRTSDLEYTKIKYKVKELELNAELIEIREPLRFKDILITDNEYKLI